MVQYSIVIIAGGIAGVTLLISAPDFIKHSPLANDSGLVDVDKYNLQHNTYLNVFFLEDASSLPNSKTAVAARSQTPVFVHNLLSEMADEPLDKKYNSYACRPLVTGYDKVILAKFDYEENPSPSFLLEPTKERCSM